MFTGNMWFLLEDQHHSKIHSLSLTVIQLDSIGIYWSTSPISKLNHCFQLKVLWEQTLHHESTQKDKERLWTCFGAKHLSHEKKNLLLSINTWVAFSPIYAKQLRFFHCSFDWRLWGDIVGPVCGWNGLDFLKRIWRIWQFFWGKGFPGRISRTRSSSFFNYRFSSSSEGWLNSHGPASRQQSGKVQNGFNCQVDF